MQLVEEVIRLRFSPVITGGYTPFDNVLKFLALPIKFGGLGLLDPIGANPQNGQTHSNNSSVLADKLVECVCHFVGLVLKGLPIVKHKTLNIETYEK